MMRRFTDIGHGAAACRTRRKLDRSRPSQSFAGTSRTRMKCAGTINVVLTRWRSTASSQESPSNFGRTETVEPAWRLKNA